MRRRRKRRHSSRSSRNYHFASHLKPYQHPKQLIWAVKLFQSALMPSCLFFLCDIELALHYLLLLGSVFQGYRNKSFTCNNPNVALFQTFKQKKNKERRNTVRGAASRVLPVQTLNGLQLRGKTPYFSVCVLCEFKVPFL